MSLIGRINNNLKLTTMRKFLRLSLVCLMAMVCGTVFADTYKTLTFGPDVNDKKVNAYTETWTVTIGEDKWTIVNFNNNQNGWNYIRCGRKGNNASIASIETDFAIDKQIGNVIVSIDEINYPDKINSIKLVVAKDEQYSDIVETITAPNITTGDMIFEITAPTAGCYYKLIFDCAGNDVDKNGNIQVSKVIYATGAVKKSADLQFSETDIEVEQGTAFTAPTFTKATTAPVTFTSDNEEVASVNSEGKISLGGELGTAKITAKSEENNEYYAGEATCTITVFAYNTYKKATTITSGKEYLIVAQSNNKTYYAYPLSKSNTYGYLKKGTEDGLTESIKVNSIYDDDFVFTEADGGYTIKDCYGRYMSSDDKYNTFNVGDEALIWTVEKQLDGTFKISMDNKFVQWTNSKDFGCWDTMQETAALPYLYEKYEVPTGITDVTVEKEFDENAPIYNLSGQRVDKNAKGILIQNGKKFIRR